MKIMLNTFSRSLIIWEPAIETWAHEMNGGPGNKLGARRAEQFPHLWNYTLTPVYIVLYCIVLYGYILSPVWRCLWRSVVCSEATRKRPLSPSTETARKVLATESRDRPVRHDDVTSGEDEYDAEAHGHLSFDCSVCWLFNGRPAVGWPAGCVRSFSYMLKWIKLSRVFLTLQRGRISLNALLWRKINCVNDLSVIVAWQRCGCERELSNWWVTSRACMRLCDRCFNDRNEWINDPVLIKTPTRRLEATQINRLSDRSMNESSNQPQRFSASLHWA